jgi:CRISPR-associated protein Csb1
MSELLTQYDAWLNDQGPAALVIRELLLPAEGPDGVIFPPTYAASEDKSLFAGGYNIDEFPDGTNVCLIDSVGSQANRMEPLFAKPDYRGLVPQIIVRAGDVAVNLLQAGHRAGDAVIRCSALHQDLHAAFQAALRGNHEPLAKIAPTSLVFGVWDSRDTQAKVPRLVSSTIRAFNVRKLTRSAQYIPPVDYINRGLLAEPADKKQKDTYAERGFIHVPASGTPGGVIAQGGIRRDAILSLAALRLLAAENADRTRALRRYILGLALVAFTYSPIGYLRQGCNLVLNPEKPRECLEVHCDGQRRPITLNHEEARRYAQEAAQVFGVGQDRDVTFDTTRAQTDVAGETQAQPRRRGRPPRSASQPTEGQ